MSSKPTVYKVARKTFNVRKSSPVRKASPVRSDSTSTICEDSTLDIRKQLVRSLRTLLDLGRKDPEFVRAILFGEAIYIDLRKKDLQDEAKTVNSTLTSALDSLRYFYSRDKKLFVRDQKLVVIAARMNAIERTETFFKLYNTLDYHVDALRGKNYPFLLMMQEIFELIDDGTDFGTIDDLLSAESKKYL